VAGVGSAYCQRLPNTLKTNFNMAASKLSKVAVREAVI